MQLLFVMATLVAFQNVYHSDQEHKVFAVHEDIDNNATAGNPNTPTTTIAPDIDQKDLINPSVVHIQSNDSLKLSTFSVYAWFNTSFTGIDKPFHLIVNKGGMGEEKAGYNLNYGIWMDNAHRIRGGFEAKNGSDVYLKSIESYNDNRWHNVILTFNGTGIGLYVDGELVDSKIANVQPDNTGDMPVTIGANSLRFNNFFYGHIDEVFIFDRALSTQEIQNSLRTGSLSSSGVVLHYSFGKIHPVVEDVGTGTQPGGEDVGTGTKSSDFLFNNE